MEDFKRILKKTKKVDRDSMYQVAVHLIKVHSTPDYETEALKRLMIYEKGNKIEAMYLLGTLYSNYICDEDDEIEKDMEKAVYWYKKAAQFGHKEAMKGLGHFYFNGDGVERDYEKAFNYFKESDTKYWLGICYARGLGVQEDEEKALHSFIKYYNNGYMGILQLANIYYGESDEKEFKYYMMLLDLAENADILNVVGEMYLDGKGVNQDKAKAVQYFLKALDDSERMIDGGLRLILNLIDCYLKGNGVPQDLNEAIKYFKIYRDRVCEILQTNPPKSGSRFWIISGRMKKYYMKDKAEVLDVKSGFQISDDEVRDILLNGKWDDFYRKRKKNRAVPNSLGARENFELI